MKAYPLIKIVIIFISGIICQKYLALNFQILLLISFVSFLLILLILILKVNSKALTISLVAISVAASGSLALEVSNLRIVPYPFKSIKLKDVNLYGHVSEIELKKTGEFRFTLKSDSIGIKNSVMPMKLKILCKVFSENKNKLDSVFNFLEVGNVVLIKGTISKARTIRNPGEFDYQKYLESKGYSAILSCRDASELKVITKSLDFTRNLISEVRKEIDETIQENNDKETAALLRGLLLADRSEIGDEVQTDFINTGVVHILAVSGSNVLLILIIFMFFFSRLNIYLRTLIMILGLACFLIITGTSPSVFRAVIMASVVLVSFLANRGVNICNSLAISALVILLSDAGELFDPGFQMSFAAVIAISAVGSILVKHIGPYLNKRFKLMKLLLIYVSVSLAAQIGTLPFTLFYFGKLSLIAPLANLLIIPLIAVITGGEIAALLLNPIWTWAAGIYFGACNVLTEIVYFITHQLSSIRYSFLYIRSFSLIDSLIFYSLITLAFIFYPRLKTLKARLIFPAALTVLLIGLIRLDNKELLPENKLSLVAIDVGQGDATLIKFPDGKTALIDAGLTTLNFDNGEKIILPLLNYLGIDEIDYGFISHIDMDHYSGFISLLNKGIIKKIYKPPPDIDYPNDVKLENFLRNKPVPFGYYNKEIINTGSARIYLLNNSLDFQDKSLSRNDRSAVIRIVYGNNSFLFTGDAGKLQESMLIEKYKSGLKSDFLKLGHHGSKNSSSWEFLNCVKPEEALISCGPDNSFGHPALVVLERLRQLNIKALRTDLEGAVILASDGNKIQNISWRNE